MKHYALTAANKVIVCNGGISDAQFLASRRVAKDEIIIDGEEITISTVLLPMDHNLDLACIETLERRLNAYGYYKDKMPQLFETMVFGGEHDEFQVRYPTYNEALKHHKLIVESLVENNSIPKIQISPNWLEDYLKMFEV